MGNNLVPRPPYIIEAVVSALLPASRRDDVLGDLHERYTSPLGYLRDAAQLVPITTVSHALHRRRHVVSPASARASAAHDHQRGAAVLVTWFTLARPALLFGGWYLWLSMLGAVGRLRGMTSTSETDAD